MASISGEFHCCADCACLIANNDTTGLDYYGDEYRENWEQGVSATRDELPDGYPVINCPEGCDGTDAREFMCDFCSRNVYSHKFDLTFLI